jgi:hypothetical protein
MRWFRPFLPPGNDDHARDARSSPGLAGRLPSRISPDDYVEKGPELAAEISASSAALDLGDKLLAYQRNDVREYIVWHVPAGQIHWFVLRGDRYEPLMPDATGAFRSEVFPGLWLDAPALLRGDLAALQACVQRGTATAEHAAFVERLRASRP